MLATIPLPRQSRPTHAGRPAGTENLQVGNYIAMLGGYLDLLDIAEVIRQKREDTPDKTLVATLSKGTRIICHDFMNGSSSTDFVLLKDLKVEVTGKNSLHRDGKHKYGVQDVCGYIGEAWDSPLTLELV